MSKPRLVVFYGGESSNADLSKETGVWVCSHIPRASYDVTPVEITEDGKWKVPLGSLPRSGPVLATLSRLSEALPALPAANALERLLRKPVDALMTLVRGRGGDDGSIHAIGNIIGAPVIGSSQRTSQQTSDKYLFSQAVDGVALTPYSQRYSRKKSIDSVVKDIREEFLPPLFLKPASQEGSFGIEFVSSHEEIQPAVTRIFTQDDVIAQEYIPGDEFTVSLVEDRRGSVQVLPPTIIIPKHAPFYDRQAKRSPNRVTMHVSPDDTNAVVREVKDIARDVYDELDCRGAVSMDMIAGDEGISVLEVNTIPTLTEYTPMRRQFKKAGLHPLSMFDGQIRRGLEEGI